MSQQNFVFDMLACFMYLCAGILVCLPTCMLVFLRAFCAHVPSMLMCKSDWHDNVFVYLHVYLRFYLNNSLAIKKKSSTHIKMYANGCKLKG